MRENSLYVTGCIGVEEIPKKRPKHLAWNISKTWWRPFLSHVLVFFVLNQWRIHCFTIIIRLEIVYWTSINISCNKETLEICKTIYIVISNSLKLCFHFLEDFLSTYYFYFFSFMSVLIDSLILKTWNSVLDID